MLKVDYTKDEFIKILQRKMAEVLAIKHETTEHHLEQILQCRSWEEIKASVRVEYHQTPGGPKEIWYFGDKKLLTVQLNPMDDGKLSFMYRRHV